LGITLYRSEGHWSSADRADSFIDQTQRRHHGKLSVLPSNFLTQGLTDQQEILATQVPANSW